MKSQDNLHNSGDDSVSLYSLCHGGNLTPMPRTSNFVNTFKAAELHMILSTDFVSHSHCLCCCTLGIILHCSKYVCDCFLLPFHSLD